MVNIATPPRKPAISPPLYFHRPEEVQQELKAAGCSRHVATLPVEGPGWLPLGERFDEEWADPKRRGRLMDVVQAWRPSQV